MTDRENINRRQILKTTGTVAFAGAMLPGVATAHPPEEVRFCGCSQVCVNSEESYRIVYAIEEDSGYSCRISPGTDEAEHREPGCFTADDDEKIIGVLGGARHMYHNPNNCAEKALNAVTLNDCTGCVDNNCNKSVTYTQTGKHTYEVDSEDVIVRTNQCKPPKKWTSDGKHKNCDIVVPDDASTIQAAVNEADSGGTICIEQGTYEESLTIDTEVTLRGQNAPKSDNPVELDGDIEITPDGSGTTIRRLRIAPSETFQGGRFPDPFGVQIKASDVVVENNIIEDLSADLSNGEGSFTLHGIQIFGSDDADVSNITVRDNVIRGFENAGTPGMWPEFGGIAGVKVQADVENVTVTDNEITDHHSAGWVWGVVLTGSGSAPGIPEDVTVKQNDISELNDGSEYDVFDGANDGRDGAPYPGSAFGIDGNANADEATVKKNNLLAPNGAESKDGDNTLVAECNWWDDKSGPTHDDNSDGEGTWALEGGAVIIDYTPWLTSTAPSNTCNGGTKNNNGKGNESPRVPKN